MCKTGANKYEQDGEGTCSHAVTTEWGDTHEGVDSKLHSKKPGLIARMVQIRCGCAFLPEASPTGHQNGIRAFQMDC